ncbi:hypothetical protein [Gallaecimonas pentaromativorans]|uniref:hypothetical protein n=1 Tax=Gallaecimonas pentaromativorans TaxID=584787 RepID=UPI003A928750
MTSNHTPSPFLQGHFAALHQAMGAEHGDKLPPQKPAVLKQQPLSDPARALCQEYAAALARFSASAQAEALRERLSCAKSNEDLARSLFDAFASDDFARTRQLAEEYSLRDDFGLQSLTLGADVEVAFLFGIQGNISIGLPITTLRDFDTAVLCVSGMVSGGIDETAFVGVTGGVWSVTPEGLSGWSVTGQAYAGFEGEVVVQGGLSISLFPPDVLGWGVLLSLGGGEGGGADVGISYGVVFPWDAPRVYQPRARNYMIINSITCNKASEMGKDEVYLMFTIDNDLVYRYPTHGQFSMGDNSSWGVGRSIYFNDNVKVQLFDNDTGNNDSLGQTTYQASNFQSQVTVSGSSGKYTLDAVLEPMYVNWDNPKHINNVDSTIQSPAACVFNDTLYVFWRGATNNRIYCSPSTDGEQWPDGHTINNVDSTDLSPAAVAFQGQLFVFWQGGNKGLYWSASSDGKTWPPGTPIRQETTPYTPTPCVFDNRLYVFWVANDSSKRLIYSIFDPSTGSWSNNAPVNSTDEAISSVSACVFKDELYLFHVNSSNQTRFTASASNSWPGSSPTGATILATLVSACTAQGGILLSQNDPQYWPMGYSPALFTASRIDKWGASAVVGNIKMLAQSGPALVTYQKTPYLFYTDTNERLLFCKAKP